mmetsp:Transcript_81819/g.227883  ORF Transcript_81819/g.227883 Transcript_81819/m.227883 type:complete len:131 (+) Transcript_81819:228-620(+)|eukprot:CAMPEP_0117621864 /NCGR_PEP_ID=MMETSP0784-20121206/87851_1 /TAXON_ID=39447 /ORGANISM="" /LENGTH=130 /DNA_ID=CAMNT_0005425797 /DNA_START=145 /DNA_END=537 /DNA_ORIENTATION=-
MALSSETNVAADAPQSTLLFGVLPQEPSIMMLNSLFAMVFAAVAIGVLHAFGFVGKTGRSCPESEFYSSCAVVQDLRSLMSFVLGAAVCCVLSRSEGNEEEEGAEDQDGEVEVAGRCRATGELQFLACLW